MQNTKNKAKITEAKPMNLLINGIALDSDPLDLSAELTQDKTNINVSEGTIKIQMKEGSGPVSIVGIDIIPQAKPAVPLAVRKEVSKNTFIGGDCKTNGLNCLFDVNEITDKEVCKNNVLIKIGSKAKSKECACKYKCIQKDYENVEECQK